MSNANEDNLQITKEELSSLGITEKEFALKGMSDYINYIAKTEGYKFKNKDSVDRIIKSIEALVRGNISMLKK